MNRLKPFLVPGLLMLLLSACATKIPILAVQLSDDDGTHATTVTKHEIYKWVKSANKTWKKRGYKLVFRGRKDMVRVKSTLLNSQPADNNDDNWEIYRIAGNYLASELPSDHVPVYFRGRGSGAWSWGPGNTNFISMPSFDQACMARKADGAYCHRGCCTDLALLSHELGHYFGLAHTFTDADCTRLTKDNSDGDLHGQLPDVKEDDVRDTAPDPGAGCVPAKLVKCDGGSVVVSGVHFQPPWNNLMSNYVCGVRQKITDDQARVIQYSLKQPWRSEIGKGD